MAPDCGATREDDFSRRRYLVLARTWAPPDTYRRAHGRTSRGAWRTDDDDDW